MFFCVIFVVYCAENIQEEGYGEIVNIAQRKKCNSSGKCTALKMTISYIILGKLFVLIFSETLCYKKLRGMNKFHDHFR